MKRWPMRRFFSGLLVTLLILSQCAAAWAESAEGGQDDASESALSSALQDYVFAEVTVQKGTLNMRKQPKSTAQVITKLPNGSLVRVLESEEKWTKVFYNDKNGYVQTAYLTTVDELPYQTLQVGDKGPEVRKLKNRLIQLEYLDDKKTNDRFDEALEKAIRRLEMLNGLPQTGIATPELQAFIFWEKLQKNQSGATATATDEASGLTATIIGWASGYYPVKGTDKINVSIRFITNVTGGVAPYTTTVKRTYKYEESAASGATVESPCSVTWRLGVAAIFLTLIVEDAEGNSVSAKVRVGIVRSGYEFPPGYENYPNN